MKTISKLLLASWLAAITLNATADEYIEWVAANSGVNWSAGQATAEGAGVGPTNKPASIARLMACRAAVVDAQRNLLESMQGVRVNGTTVVNDLMLKSDVIKTTVEGVLKGATITKRNPKDDGTCLVTMVAPIGGDLTQVVYNETMNPDAIATSPTVEEMLLNVVDLSLAWLVPEATAATSAPPWQTAIDNMSQRITALEELLSTNPVITGAADQGPTGLVLDARGSNFIPSMSPKIRKIRAGVMYPAAKHQVAARDRGQLVSLFTRDIDSARKHPIVGERPIVIKALRTFGDTRTEIVLGSESSERLEDLIKNGFLDDAGVIIVL